MVCDNGSSVFCNDFKTMVQASHTRFLMMVHFLSKVTPLLNLLATALIMSFFVHSLHTYQVSRLSLWSQALTPNSLNLTPSLRLSHSITINYNDYDINSLEEIKELDCISHAEK